MGTYRNINNSIRLLYLTCKNLRHFVFNSCSKAKRKEEAQKLPEVSKEIFYDVAVDLKAVLGSTKRDEKVEIAPWDKEDDVEEASPADTETLKCRTVNSQQKENSNFTFSFFSAEEERSPTSEGTTIYSKA